jgi:hypothetical protein
LLDPSEVNKNDLSSVRREGSGHSRNNKREYLKDKINEFESNSKNKKTRDLYRGIDELKKGYQPRTNVVRDKGVIYLRVLMTFLIGEKITHFSY